MNNFYQIHRIIAPVIYFLAQVTIARNLVLFNSAFCFLYLGYILLLPIQIGKIRLLFIAFVYGLLIDVFYDSLGIHAAASVLVAFIRPAWLNLITPRGGYENVNMPSVKELSLGWFMTYAIPLIFIHTATLFFIEASRFSMFFLVLGKVVFSTLFTFVILSIIQYLFYGKSRGL